jgi:hypothetical protein
MSDELKNANEAVSNLLNSLGITRVICVDDFYGRAWSDDDLLEAQQSLTQDELRAIFGRPDDVFADDKTVRRQSFREAWQAVGIAQRDHIATRIMTMAAANAPEEPSDVVASHALADIIGSDRLVTMRPSQWPETKQKIMQENSASKTLLLFDQDLANEGGPTGGMVLAQDVLADTGMDNRVMCGLLTHTATIENQHEKWAELAKPPLDQDRFIVVAKGWLSRDPLGFARMLKMVALLPDCRAMKLKCKELLDQANKKAHEDIDKIHINDFDSMVFRASKQEGLWEPDMLFRLFGIYHRSAVRQLAYTDDPLQRISARLRSVSEIPTDSSTSIPLTTWKVQREELYDSGAYLNELHLPIEIGDIFAKTDAQSEKYYILLGQPCDLMVRTEGKRMPEVSDVMLAEIFTADEAKQHSVLLPHFSNDDPKKKFYVRLRPVNFLNPCVLDLCVYNKDGVSRINVDEDSPPNVLPAWKAKYEYLKRYALGLIRRYAEFGVGKVDNAALAYMKSESAKQFPLATSNRVLFKASMSFAPGSRSLSFNCKRVTRLQSARALAISMEYVHCLTRPAFDRDLGS